MYKKLLPCVIALCSIIAAQAHAATIPDSFKPTKEERTIFESIVKKSLKDPDSAVFGDAFRTDKNASGNRIACIEVNAKNSYGGYTGFQSAFLFNTGGGWEIQSIDEDNSEGICKAMLETAIKRKRQASENQ